MNWIGWVDILPVIDKTLVPCARANGLPGRRIDAVGDETHGMSAGLDSVLHSRLACLLNLDADANLLPFGQKVFGVAGFQRDHLSCFVRKSNCEGCFAVRSLSDLHRYGAAFV